ncbi:MAG: NINE protein [Saprospiraceae bacterium]|nr:NINE protein [Saprospiraceae bacterium]
MKKKAIAIFLALFLGAFGVHRFYLRQPELGIAYVAITIWLGRFFGFPLSALLGWYDAYKFMIMDGQEFDRRYNNHYFRDRYGRRRETPSGRAFEKRGRYILIEEEEGKAKSKKQPSGYFQNLKKVKDAENYKQEGIRKFKQYDAKGAIEAFRKALENDPSNPTVHFNIACAYSVEEMAMEAFEHLDHAISLGFRETAWIMTTEALAYIRVLPAFDAFRQNGFRLSSAIAASLKEDLQKVRMEQFDLQQKVPVKLKSDAS